MKIKKIQFGKTFTKNEKQYKVTGVELGPKDASITAEDLNGKIVSFGIEEETDDLCTPFYRLHCQTCPHFNKDCAEW